MRSYRHIGAQALVLDDGRKEPGDRFEADFPPSYEAFLLKAGIVEVIKPSVVVAEPIGREWISPELDAPAPKKKG